MDTFDFVVVGSGAAGSVLAARLSEDGKHSVCVLEHGPLDSNRYIRIPAGFMKTIFDPDVTFQYFSEPVEGTAKRKVRVILGRTVGGGTSVNGMLYVRGVPSDFDGWAAAGNPGWSYREVLPYFKRNERRMAASGAPADDRYRGRAGALPVCSYQFPDALCEAFMDAAAACGIPHHAKTGADYNGASQFGTGRFQAMIENGRRVSAADAFLHPVVRRGRVDLRTRAQVSRIRFEDAEGRSGKSGKSRAVGVDYTDGDGAKRSVDARRGVVLAAGTVNSPKLLQLSGIGPAALLKQHGIAVQHDLPAVGENLRDHYTARHVYRTRDARSLNSLAGGLPLAWQVLRWQMGLSSILSIPPGLCYAFGKTDPAMADPDVQLTFMPASMKEGTVGLLDDYPGMTCGVWKHRPDSSGHVRITSADPNAAPLINPRYLSDERDRRTAVAALRLVRKIFATDPLSRYAAANTLPGPRVESDDELLDFARQYGSGTYHLTGTCRMGAATDAGTVVGPDLKVHGTESLYVVDGSVMPTEPSANTYAPILMIAEKGADMILGKQPLPAAML